MILLTDEILQQIAMKFNIEFAILKAVSQVESAGRGFYIDEGKWLGELKVLFEGHYFYKFTKGKYSKSRPDLCYKKWTRKYYRKGQEEFTRFLEASKLNKEAALLSASWGMFQIMGANHKDCGYSSVFEMIDSFYKGGEPEQLVAFLNYCTKRKGVNRDKKSTNISLLLHLKHRQFELFTGGYNGVGQINYYSTKLRDKYNYYASRKIT